MKRTRVAYLGPEGTYTHKVARKRFGQKCEYLPHPAIGQVFDSVIAKRAEFGVVPVESSSGGTVYDTVDMLVDHGFPHEKVAIREELSINVTFALLGRKRSGRIERVYSHFAALKHCEKWLRANVGRDVMLCRVSSTAAAA